MKGILKADDLVLFGGDLRAPGLDDLEGAFHGFGAGVAEEGALEAAHGREAFGKPALVFVIVKVGGVHELARLFVLTGQQGATFITAENPTGKTVTAEENAANQVRLQQDLTKLGATVLAGAGEGQDPEWPAEASFLAIGLSRAQACELGHRYRQNAIVWIDAGAIPELVLLT